MAVESGGEGKGASVTIRVPVLRGAAGALAGAAGEAGAAAGADAGTEAAETL